MSHDTGGESCKDSGNDELHLDEYREIIDVFELMLLKLKMIGTIQRIKMRVVVVLRCGGEREKKLLMMALFTLETQVGRRVFILSTVMEIMKRNRRKAR